MQIQLSNDVVISNVVEISRTISQDDSEKNELKLLIGYGSGMVGDFIVEYYEKTKFRNFKVLNDNNELLETISIPLKLREIHEVYHNNEKVLSVVFEEQEDLNE